MINVINEVMPGGKERFAQILEKNLAGTKFQLDASDLKLNRLALDIRRDEVEQLKRSSSEDIDPQGLDVVDVYEDAANYIKEVSQAGMGLRCGKDVNVEFEQKQSTRELGLSLANQKG